MSGGGPAADAAGNIYLLTGNGVFERRSMRAASRAMGDYGNSFLKLATAAALLTVADYFTMSNEHESAADDDLGSGRRLLLPDLTDSGGTVRHLGGRRRQGRQYLRRQSRRDGEVQLRRQQHLAAAVRRARRGHLVDACMVQRHASITGRRRKPPEPLRIASATFRGKPCLTERRELCLPGHRAGGLRQRQRQWHRLGHENTSPAVLHAYDAGNLAHELYNSSQAANGRDQFGAGNKFITPTIADGKVFVGTQTGVAVFGLLN